MQTTQAPVLIIGGGVVGLSASLFLANLGVPSVLVERHPTTSIYPRARGVNGRTMELLREVGVESAVREAGARLGPAVGIYAGTSMVDILRERGSGGWLMRRMRAHGMRGKESKLSPTGPCRCTQEDLEPILLERARALGVDARFDTQLVSFAQDEAGVSATVLDRKTEKESTIRADYMIAADGARSLCRERLGVPISGDALAGHQLNIYFRADLARLVKGREFSMCVIDNGSFRGLLASIDNQSLWVFHLSYFPERGETPESFSPQRCVAIIKEALGLPLVDVTIKQISPWQSAVRIADAYSEGRIFLAGDAAHTMPPWGGFGANTGIQDAHNLAWKLALVVSRKAERSLLATYDRERMPVARTVSSIAASMNDERGLIKASSSVFSMLWMIRKVFPYMNMGYGYASSAVALEPGAPPGPQSRDLRGRPGTRAPHLWLERNGEKLSSLDLFGRSFVLLTGPGGDAWRKSAVLAARSLGIEIQSVVVGVDVVDVRGRFRSLYGLDKSGASLIRPDGIVAFRAGKAQRPTVGKLESVLRSILGRDQALLSTELPIDSSRSVSGN